MEGKKGVGEHAERKGKMTTGQKGEDAAQREGMHNRTGRGKKIAKGLLPALRRGRLRTTEDPVGKHGR